MAHVWFSPDTSRDVEKESIIPLTEPVHPWDLEW